MRKSNYRNIAIIAHVDHGKTTLLDGMLRQSGTFRENQQVADRVMDSMDLEKERGITIAAKNTSVVYEGVKINIMDTPGHADFGGEVERGLTMADGALLLVDSSEGPLPQTRFVLKKALQLNLPIILVVNKIDRADARIDVVVSQVYDLFIDLDATEEQIEFPVVYTNAKAGVAHRELGDSNQDLHPLFECILQKIPGPEADDEGVPQFLITHLYYDSYVGQVAVGRLSSGSLALNRNYTLCREHDQVQPVKLSACYTFRGLDRVPVDKLEAGDVVAVAGVENIHIGDTISDLDNPLPMPRIHVDDPTVAMLFQVNDSPLAGRRGKYLTSRHLKDRLAKETLGNVSLRVQPTTRADAFQVSGRGELQLAVLIETMRREGYEFMVSRPEVITRKEEGRLLEPVERVYLDLPEDKVGVITDKLSRRRGRMLSLHNPGHGRVNMEFLIPSRGLIGFRSQFLTDTRGAGIMNSLFEDYAPWFGDIPQRVSGVLVADRPGKVTAYASLAMTDRGVLFVEVGTEVYGGMVVGERNRPGDLAVNITREKKLTNIRSATAEATVTLRPPRLMSLDQMIEFIAEDELVEITPEELRLRKMELDPKRRAPKSHTSAS